MAYRETAIEPGTSVSLPVSTDTLIVDENSAREELVITNDSDTTVYLRLATSGAAASKGIRLNANGGSWSTSVYRGPVCGFQSGAGAKVVLVVEV